MQIKTQALIDAIDKALLDFEDRQAAWEAEVEKWRAEQKRKHVTEQLEVNWRAIRDTITNSLRSGTPITKDAVSLWEPGWRSSVRDSLFFDPKAAPPRELNGIRIPISIDKANLTSLRSTLASLADDTITHNQLAQIGFKKIEWVFRASVVNDGKLSDD